MPRRQTEEVMRIGVISTTVFTSPPSGYAGLEMIAYWTARGLASLGHEVALVAPEGSYCEGCEIISNGPPGGWDDRRAYSVYWKRLPEFDVIIDESWGKWSYKLKQERVLQAPVLGVCHAPVDTMFKTLPQGVDKPCFVCISQDQANHFRALFNREARVAYNGVDLDYYRPIARKRSNRLLFLARFSTIKGPDLAIEACLEAGVGLDLVGDTSITNEPEFLERCKQLCGRQSSFWNCKEDGQQIRFLGSCSRGETVFHYSRALALLHPNQRFREPFGLAPVEAMACGCPVVAWDNGAMRETVLPEGGVLVNSVEEFTTLVKRVGTLEGGGFTSEEARGRCREQAAKFSIQNMAKAYETLCREALDTGGW